MKSEEYLQKKLALPTLCGCGCGNPLEREGAMGPQYMLIDDKRVQVNTDCYFDAFGERFDEILAEGGLGIHGPCVLVED